jgi:hypothetical protein
MHPLNTQSQAKTNSGESGREKNKQFRCILSEASQPVGNYGQIVGRLLCGDA